VQVQEEEQQGCGRYDQRDRQCERVHAVFCADGVVFALQESGGFQGGGDRLVQQEHQRRIEDRFRQVEGEEQGNDQGFDFLDGYAHVERRDEEVRAEHDGGHADDGETHAEQRAEQVAAAGVDKAADADEDHAGEDVHDVAVDTGTADGHQLDRGDDQGHGEPVCGPEEHGTDGHDGVFEVEGKEGNLEMEENTADVREGGEDTDRGKGTDFLIGEGFFGRFFEVGHNSPHQLIEGGICKIKNPVRLDRNTHNGQASLIR